MLDAKAIEARLVWKPMHLQPVFAGCEVVVVAEELFVSGLCPPAPTLARTSCSASST